jgi:hypothetical protein
MAENFEVSFNSPQCGWMSVGFRNNENEFHSTTAHTPFSNALQEILKVLSSFLESKNERDESKVEWSRNPEAFDLFFRQNKGIVAFQVVQYPTVEHKGEEGEIVFSHNGNLKEFCRKFEETFTQLYKDRETDEFEMNWKQPFPFEDFEKFSKSLNSTGA